MWSCARPPFGDLVHALVSTFTHGCDVLASSLPSLKDFPAYLQKEGRKNKILMNKRNSGGTFRFKRHQDY